MDTDKRRLDKKLYTAASFCIRYYVGFAALPYFDICVYPCPSAVKKCVHLRFERTILSYSNFARLKFTINPTGNFVILR